MSVKNKVNKKSSELLTRIFITILVIFLYCLGRRIPLPFVSVQAGKASAAESIGIFSYMLSGDKGSSSIFALGTIPYMFATTLVMMRVAFYTREQKRFLSIRKTKKATVILTLLLAFIIAIVRTSSLNFMSVNHNLAILRLLAILIMLAGSALIYVLIQINTKRGIANATPLIMVNVVDSLYSLLQGEKLSDLKNLIYIAFIAILLTVLMETIVIKIPIQRVSVFGEYSKSNYIGFKLNPIGVTPVLFSSWIFSGIRTILEWIALLTKSKALESFIENDLQYTATFGLLTYFLIIVLMTVFLSFLFLAPSDMAQGLLETGDGIVNVEAGKATKKYLCSRLLLLSLIGGITMAFIMTLSVFLCLNGFIPEKFAGSIGSIMLVSGFVCEIISEIAAYSKFDSYKEFL